MISDCEFLTNKLNRLEKLKCDLLATINELRDFNVGADELSQTTQYVVLLDSIRQQELKMSDEIIDILHKKGAK